MNETNLPSVPTVTVGPKAPSISHRKTREVTMWRSFFKVNAAGDDEFDYLLEKLGVKGDTSQIDEVTFQVETDSVKW